MRPMRTQSVNWKQVLICLVWLLLFGTAVTTSGRGRDRAAAMAATQSSSTERHHLAQRSRFDCLPEDVQSNDIVTYGKTTNANVTVEKRLIEIKAQCRNRKLVDAKRREIKFFRPSCWGNPPADYLEIQQREKAELQKLKRAFTVIVFGCDRTVSKVLLISIGELVPSGRRRVAASNFSPAVEEY